MTTARPPVNGRWLWVPIGVAGVVLLARAVLRTPWTAPTLDEIPWVGAPMIAGHGLRIGIAVAKTLAFCPVLIAAVFAAARLYGRLAGVAMAILLATEPNFAAALPQATPTTLWLTLFLTPPLIWVAAGRAVPMRSWRGRAVAGVAVTALLLLAAAGGRRLGGPPEPSMLLGSWRETGWWWYYPVLSLYKVPVGVWFAWGVAALSLARHPLTKPEMFGLLLPAAAALAWAGASRHQTDFTPALTAYLPLLIVATRSLAVRRVGWRLTTSLCLLWAGLSGLAAFPYEADYLNRRWLNPHFDVPRATDATPSLPCVGEWLATHPDYPRPLWVALATDDRLIARYLPPHARTLPPGEPVPQRGLLVIDPSSLMGVTERQPRKGLVELWNVEPVSVLPGGVRVYDLNAVTWRPQYRAHPKTNYLWPIEPGARSRDGVAPWRP